MNKTVQPSYLVDQVLSALKEALNRGEYLPGEKLPSEARLCKEYGVSRSTIREALRVLSHLGLVETWAGKGTFVVQAEIREIRQTDTLTIEDIKDIYDFRYAVEIEAAERAALQRTDAELKKIRRYLELAKEAVSQKKVDEVVARDTDFHIAILEAGGCHFAASVYRSNRLRIEQAARALIELTVPTSSDRSLSSVQAIHDDLLDAIERKDAHGALVSIRRDRREVDAWLRLHKSSDHAD